MRILVSGGGTAGHISPILATVDALRQLGKAEFLYVGSGAGLEAKIVQSSGLEFASISAGKYRRFHGLKLHHKFLDVSSVFKNVVDVFRVLRGIWQSIGIIRSFDPDVIFIKGGYVGLPVGLAAKLLGYPFVVHESDILPGLTNRILSRWAEKVAVGFPTDKYSQWHPDKLVYTGSPVRKIITGSHRLEGISHFGFDPKLPILLILGGSQGARRINNAVLDCLDQLLGFTQIIHVTGERDIERIKFETRQLDPKLAERYRPTAFLTDNIGQALEAADVVISRAGANSIAELAILKKPTILIPNPHLVGGHQTLNAQVLSRAGAVRVITEAKLASPVLVREVQVLAESEKERDYLSGKIGEFAVPDAAQRLAKVIIHAARQVEKEKPNNEAS